MNNLSIKNILIVVLVAIIILLFFKTCKEKVDIEKPPNIVEVIKNRVIVDSIRVGVVTDSLLKIVASKTKVIASQEKKLINERILRDDIIEELNKATAGCIDSSEMRNQVTSLIQKNAEMDSLHNMQMYLSNLNVAIMEKVIIEKDNLYSRLRSQFDTCANNNLQLNAYSTQLEKQLTKSERRKKGWRTVAVIAGAAAASSFVK